VFEPIPGGSVHRIQFDDEVLEVNLPPVGFVIDKMPDPKTGKPSERLIKSEILFDDLPLVDKKWSKTKLPKNWSRWMADEAVQKKINPKYSNPEADQFRAQEWRRRINGVWIAIGNRSNKPTEYFYLTGTHYLLLAWWDTGFEVKFRVPDLDNFYVLKWAEENPYSTGVAEGANRRSGKTLRAFCWYFDAPSRFRNYHGGLQAQKRDEAKEAFMTHLRPAFMELPEFFRPVYDTSSEMKSGLFFTAKLEKGKNAVNNFDFNESEDENKPLNSKLTFKETSAKAYDKAKLHRHIAEEPAKWIEEDIYKNYLRIKPTLYEGPYLIGKLYWPTTIEEMKDGGASFVKLVEDSFPSLMKIYGHGKTKSGLIAHFRPAYRGFIFDEYGRAIVEDPEPNEVVIDERGNRVTEGAKTQLMARRKILEGNIMELTEEIRKFPFTWAEAKSASHQFCHFNHTLLQGRLGVLNAEKPRYVIGNLDWTGKKDGPVDFTPDEYKGRWKFTMLLDDEGDGGDPTQGFKIANNVGEEWDGDNERILYYPKNDHLFAMGVDPIRNVSTDDPTASKAAMYVFRRYSALIDAGKPAQKPGLPVEQRYKTNKFIVEYLTRPEDPEVFHEDMIKTCRYFGVTMFEEGNVETLRQHFKSRGYGRFLLTRGDFTDAALPGVNKDGKNAEKEVRTDDVVTHNLVSELHMYYNRYIDLVDFPNLLSYSLEFRIKKHHKKDAVFGAGYTLISSKRAVQAPPPDDDDSIPIELQINQMYDDSGVQSREIKIEELLPQQ
jgi:hypothetical protein